MEMWDVPSRLNTETESELNIIIELIYSMPEQTCALLEMRVIEEYSFKEMGKILGCSAGTAQKHYSWAMNF